MKKNVATICMLGTLILTPPTAVHAGDAQATIKKLMQLPVRQYQGECLRSVISKDVNGKELFATEKCPLIQKVDIDITPEQEAEGASKGKITIQMQCTVKNNDYYAGKLNKSFDQDKQTTISANYVYAFKELSLKNVDIKGDRFCAYPITKRIKKFR